MYLENLLSWKKMIQKLLGKVLTLYELISYDNIRVCR